MRIALLSFDLAEYTVALANALASHAEVVLLLPRAVMAPQRSKLAAAVRWMPFDKPRLRQPLSQAKMLYALLRQLEALEPDVLHLQQGHLWFNLALPALDRLPLVLTIHDPRHHSGDRPSQKTPQAVMDFGYRRADQVIVHSQVLKRVVIDELKLPEEIVHVVPHILVGDHAAGVATTERDHRILFFGRIWEYKGLEYLVRAEPLITERVPDARIVIAGAGEDFERYRRMMAHPEKFEVHNGYVSDEQRAELFAGASVVVLPYTEASQSGVIPVAYAFGKPVVATSVGGLPELVEDGRTGLLVPPRDAAALANAVVQLLNDPARRRTMGAEGRRKAERELAPGVVAEKTLAVYAQALPRRGAERIHSDGEQHKARPVFGRVRRVLDHARERSPE